MESQRQNANMVFCDEITNSLIIGRFGVCTNKV